MRSQLWRLPLVVVVIGIAACGQTQHDQLAQPNGVPQNGTGQPGKTPAQPSVSVPANVPAQTSASTTAIGPDVDGTNTNLANSTQPSKPVKLSAGVYDVPIILPKSLEGRRAEFRNDFIQAETRLRAFAAKYNWAKFADPPLVDKLEIYESEGNLRLDKFEKTSYLIAEGEKHKASSYFTPDYCNTDKANELSETPKEFLGGIQSGTLFAVTPECYESTFPDAKEPDAFIKLLMHELAHHLYARVCTASALKQNPRWFIEGFAGFAADQHYQNVPTLSNAEILSIVDGNEILPSYKIELMVFRHIVEKTDLPTLVKKAGLPDFTSWLKSVCLQ